MSDSSTGLARRLEQHGAGLRACAGGLVMAAGALAWQSLAADHFRSEVDDLARHLRAVAGRMDHAAAAVRSHTGQVRAVVTGLQSTERLAGAALGELRHWLGQ